MQPEYIYLGLKNGKPRLRFITRKIILSQQLMLIGSNFPVVINTTMIYFGKYQSFKLFGENKKPGTIDDCLENVLVDLDKLRECSYQY